MKTTVTTKNMITIPAAITRMFDISAGCQFEWTEIPGEASAIHVKVIPKRGDMAKRLLGQAKKWSPERHAVDELIEERRRDGLEENQG